MFFAQVGGNCTEADSWTWGEGGRTGVCSGRTQTNDPTNEPIQSTLHSQNQWVQIKPTFIFFYSFF